MTDLQVHVAGGGQTLAVDPELPDGLAIVPVSAIQPCPIQPRVNISVELVRKLAASMQAGRHEPVLEVEPAPGKSDGYQIVCGEQRWRAARAAGVTRVLVRLHPSLGYLERLEKQYEENRLRADLDVFEEAHCIVLDKTLRDIAVAERLLAHAHISFPPLADKQITDRAAFAQHLDGLAQLLIAGKVHVLKVDGRLVTGTLAPWHDTERALGISKSGRKARVAILRIEPGLRERLRGLPAEHASQIARLTDPLHQAELARRAAGLTHRQVRAAVDRLRRDPRLAVEAVLPDANEARSLGSVPAGPLAFEQQLRNLADACRQLARTLTNLRPRLSPSERSEVLPMLSGLREVLLAFEEVA